MRLIAAILSVIMLCGSILPAGDMHEMPKIANLIRHFEQHLKEENNKLSFLDYLELHYAGAEANDQGDHQNLPFHHLCAGAFAAVLPALGQAVRIQDEPSEYIILYNFSVVRDHIPNVWQPPRV